MSKKTKRVLAFGGIVLLVAVTVAICYFLFTKKTKPDLLYDTNATIGIMPGVDIDARRAELQNILDRTMIAFSINTSPVFLNGTTAGNLLIENPGNNAKLLQVSIYIAGTEEKIYASKYLKPGSYIETAKLDKVLEKGTYDAVAYFSAYDEDTGEYIGQVGAEIVITVQN